MLKLKLEPLLAAGVEYYAALGPIGALLPAGERCSSSSLMKSLSA